MTKTVVVCEARVPFVSGGAERLVEGLVDRLRQHGYRAERVHIPFKWYPKDALLSQIAAWRLIDLTETNGTPIDAVIATKFPTYFVQHPCKVTWLLHQYRAIYELCGTPYSEFTHSEADVALRDRMIALDTEALGESAGLFAIARNTAARLQKYNGLTAETLYHPPPLAGRLRPGPLGEYVLSIGRLEATKRVDLIIRALARAGKTIQLIVAGEGPLRPRLEALAAEEGVAARVRFVGGVGEDALADLYAEALAVVFPPFDEDYGYVTLEAFLAHKPVITTTDAGGPLEFVDDGVTGLVAEPDPDALGAAIAKLVGDKRLAQSLGDAGYARASAITWDGVVERLMGAAAR